MSVSSGIRAGRAFVEMYADSSKLNAALDAAKKRIEAFAKFTAKIGLGAAAAGGSVLAPIAKMFTEAVTRGSDIDSLAQRFGTTAEAMSALSYAFERGGAGLDEFAGSMAALNSKLIAGADGADDLFIRLGLDARKLIELPLDQALLKVVDAFKRIRLSGDQATVASELFGSAGEKMLPYLKQGSAAFIELAKQGKAAGAVLSAGDAKKSSDVMRAFTATWQAAKYAILEVGAALLPTVHDLTAFTQDIRAGAAVAGAWIREHKHVIVAITGVAAGFVAAGTATVGLAMAAGFAGKVIGTTMTVISGIGSAITMLLSPIGLTTAAIAGLGFLWAKTTDNGKAFTNALTDGFTGASDALKKGIAGTFNALKSGDWKLAGETMMAGLQLAWAEGIKALSAAWNAFQESTVGKTLKAFVIGAGAMIDAAKATGNELGRGLSLNGAGGAGGAGGGGAAGDASDPTFLEKNVARWGGLFEAIKSGSLEAGREYARNAEDGIRQGNEAAKKGADAFRKIEEEKIEGLKKKLDELFNKSSGGGISGKMANFSAAMAEVVGDANKQAAAAKIEGPRLPSLPDLAKSVKGATSLGSNSLAAMQFGFGDQVGQRQIALQQTIATNTADTVAALGKLTQAMPATPTFS